MRPLARCDSESMVLIHACAVGVVIVGDRAVEEGMLSEDRLRCLIGVKWSAGAAWRPRSSFDRRPAILRLLRRGCKCDVLSTLAHVKP